MEALLVSVFPVTMAELCVWLDALVAEGREAEALRHMPRAPLGRYGDDGPPVLQRDGAGRFFCGPDSDGDPVLPDLPALNVDWKGALAYARWLRDRTGEPWRLPAELEWEKAAGGVDGRIHPWGRADDVPGWCCCRDARPGPPGPAVVDSYPVDVSPYGVRGVAGNVRDWTSSVYSAGWSGLDGDRVLPGPDEPALAPEARVVGRGGGWPLWVGGCNVRAAVEDRPDFRHPAVGFRLVRALLPEDLR
jgi:serine/threonine-protein kinase